MTYLSKIKGEKTMITFKEYVSSLRHSKLHYNPDFGIVMAIIGISCLLGIGVALGSWFRLLWIGIVPIVIYINYCNKKEFGELD